MKKVFKIISVIIALAAVAGAVYLAVKKLTDKKTPEYFDDNDFFECDNEIEIVEAKKDEPVEEEAPVEEAPAEEKPKKRAAKKTAKAE